MSGDFMSTVKAYFDDGGSPDNTVGDLADWSVDVAIVYDNAIAAGVGEGATIAELLGKAGWTEETGPRGGTRWVRGDEVRYTEPSGGDAGAVEAADTDDATDATLDALEPGLDHLADAARDPAVARDLADSLFVTTPSGPSMAAGGTSFIPDIAGEGGTVKLELPGGASPATVNHELAHGVAELYGYDVDDAAVDVANDYGVGADNPPDEHYEAHGIDGADDLKFDRVRDPDAPDGVEGLIGAVNEAVERQYDAAIGGGSAWDNLTIGDSYSATNAHETLALTHESLSFDPDANDGEGIEVAEDGVEALATFHPDLLEAYVEVLEPSDWATDRLQEHFDDPGTIAMPPGNLEAKAWERYRGPLGGSGWRNVNTGDVAYSDEPPGDRAASDYPDSLEERALQGSRRDPEATIDAVVAHTDVDRERADRAVESMPGLGAEALLREAVGELAGDNDGDAAEELMRAVLDAGDDDPPATTTSPDGPVDGSTDDDMLDRMIHGAKSKLSGWLGDRLGIGAKAGWTRETGPEGATRWVSGDVEEKSWVPYTGDRGGTGWRNVKTGDVDYSDEPPGGVDMSALDEEELLDAAAARLGDEGLAELVEQHGDDRSAFEDALSEAIGVSSNASEANRPSPGGLDAVPDDADPREFDPDAGRGSLEPGDEVVFSAGAHGVHRGEVVQAPDSASFGYIAEAENGATFKIDPEDVSSFPGQGMDPSDLEEGMVVSNGSAFGEVVRLTGDDPVAAYVDFSGDGDSDDMFDADQLVDADAATSAGGPGGSINSGDVEVGDKIVIDGVEAEVDRVSDMGGGWYIAGRDANGDVQTARVGPTTDFDTWGDEGPSAGELGAAPGDRVSVGGADDVEVASVDPKGCGPGETELEDVNGQTYCVTGDDVERIDDEPGGPRDSADDYDVSDDGFDRELAEAVVAGEPMGTDTIYRNMGKVDDPHLVADALALELATKDRKTSRERLESKLGTFADGPTVAEVRSGMYEQPGPESEPGADGDYPGDFDSAADELDALVDGDHDLVGNSSLAEGGYGYDLEGIGRLHEHATTEELEAAMDRADSDFSSAVLTDEGELVAGLLTYRDDSDVTWEDAIPFSGNGGVADPEEVRSAADESFGMLDPAVGALTIQHLQDIRVTDRPADSPNRIGVYKHRIRSIEVHKEDAGYQPSTTKHEIGHGVQFAMGVTGHSGRDNTSKNDSEPWNWDYDVSTPSPYGGHDTPEAEDLRDEVEAEIDRYKDRAEKVGTYGNECRTYQRTNASEFMAVTFAHWQDDRGKLEEKNPEMADLWDRHVGRGVETEPVDVPTQGDLAGMEDRYEPPEGVNAEQGDRVNVVTVDGEEIRNAELTGVNGYGVETFSGPEIRNLDWAEVESMKTRSPVAGGVEDDPLPDVEDVEKPRLERAARNVLSDEEVREMPLVAPRGRLNEWINDLPPAKVINIQQELRR